MSIAAAHSRKVHHLHALLHPATLSTSWWEAEDSPPCPGLLTGSPLQRTTEHLRTGDRLSSPPFQHMPSLHSSSTRYWHFCLATSPLGSHEGVVFFILVFRGTLMLAGLYWQMPPPQSPRCSVLPLPITVWGRHSCGCAVLHNSQAIS